ncbi:F-box and associated interaction domains-containing protein [Thalictrum thalictroides]|uniref:F-box and associated interaction domains-containing protein n=1 Tax=Thalictrum thalictroides TaxID=46969 RepID=A0A7J6UWB6_THATH|nr:F-box and associated interaction domains-containing protein [Thalictrum thalictroides]
MQKGENWMAMNADFGKDDDNKLYIPHEINQDILSRLPVKTISRFKCVSKLWCSLPSDTEFVEMHLKRSLNASNVIILSHKAEEDHSLLSFYSLDKAEDDNKTKLMFTIPLFLDVYAMEPSCNGLVCFSALLRQEIYVCNPSIRKFILLPKLSFSDTRAYSPCKVVGFGFDDFSGKYKVMCAFHSQYFDWSLCFIFTLGSTDGKWRQLDDIPLRIQSMQSAYLNGVVHWILEGSLNPLTPDGILTFNFQNEEYGLLPLPNCQLWNSYTNFWGLHSFVHLKVIGGYMRLVTTLDGSDAGYWTLGFWTLRDYKNHVWTYDFRFSFDIISEYLRFSPPIPVDILNGMVLLSAGGKLYVHNVRRETTSEIKCDFPLKLMSLLIGSTSLIVWKPWFQSMVVTDVIRIE